MKINYNFWLGSHINWWPLKFLLFVQTGLNTWIGDFNKGCPRRESNNGFPGRPHWTPCRSAAVYTSLLTWRYGKRYSHTPNAKLHFLWRNRSVHVEKLFDTCCQYSSAALVTICARFLSCWATGLFLDVAAPVVELDLISVCLHLANRCSTKKTQISEPFIWGWRSVPPQIKHGPSDDALCGQHHLWYTYSICHPGYLTHFTKSVSIIWIVRSASVCETANRLF